MQHTVAGVATKPSNQFRIWQPMLTWCLMYSAEMRCQMSLEFVLAA